MLVTTMFPTLLLVFVVFLRGTYAEEDYKAPEEKPATHIPKFTSRESNQRVGLGETVLIDCSVDDIDGFVLMWRKGTSLISAGTMLITPDRHKFFVFPNMTLQIQRTQKEDAGVYTCQISAQQDILQQNHVVEILVQPSVSKHPDEGIIVARQGETVRLVCAASGYPPPVITWTLRNGGTEDHMLPATGDSLLLSDIHHSESGTYTCEAANSVGKPARAKFSVDVLFKPEIEINQKLVHSAAGVMIDLSCTVKANPPAKIIWSRNSKSLNIADQRVSIQELENVAVLRIHDVKPEDYDNYTCRARNTLELSTKVVEVSGEASPVEVRSMKSGDTTYSIEFSSESLSPLIEYKLMLREMKNETIQDDWTEVMIPADQSNALQASQKYMIEGLQPATMYEVVMQARNQNGWNRNSPPFSFSTSGGNDQSNSISNRPANRELEPLRGTDSVSDPDSGTAEGCESLTSRPVALIVPALITVISTYASSSW